MKMQYRVGRGTGRLSARFSFRGISSIFEKLMKKKIVLKCLAAFALFACASCSRGPRSDYRVAFSVRKASGTVRDTLTLSGPTRSFQAVADRSPSGKWTLTHDDGGRWIADYQSDGQIVIEEVRRLN